MKSLVVNIPDNLDMDTLQLTRFLAATLYEKGDLTLSQAAEMAGMTIWEFPEVLAKLGLPFFNYTSEDFKKEYRFPMSHL
jgi:predicted HTH domain antitoxin